MKLLCALGLLAAFTAAFAAPPRTHAPAKTNPPKNKAKTLSSATNGEHPGSWRWDVKTLADANESGIDFSNVLQLDPAVMAAKAPPSNLKADTPEGNQRRGGPRLRSHRDDRRV